MFGSAAAEAAILATANVTHRAMPCLYIRTRKVCPSGDVSGLLPTAVPVDHADSGQKILNNARSHSDARKLDVDKARDGARRWRRYVHRPRCLRKALSCGYDASSRESPSDIPPSPPPPTCPRCTASLATYTRVGISRPISLQQQQPQNADHDETHVLENTFRMFFSS